MLFLTAAISFCTAVATADCHGTACPAVDLLQRKLSLQSAMKSEAKRGLPETTGRAGIQMQYGKYVYGEDDNAQDNSLYVYWPKTGKPVKAPVVIEFHAGGFVSEAPLAESTTTTDLFNGNGFVFISVGYRVFPNSYHYYDEDSNRKEEEFVNIAEDSSLSLDTNGRLYKDFVPHVGYTEVLPKVFYDAGNALEFVISNADYLGIDPHNIVFMGGSCGCGISNYLTFLYHKAHSNRFSVRVLLFAAAQLNYPVEPFTDAAWRLFGQAMGADSSLVGIIDDSSCPYVLGASACDPERGGATWEYEYCNTTWHAHRMEHYCNEESSWMNLTIMDAVEINRWPDYPRNSYEKRLETLWYLEDAMAESTNHDVALYVANYWNGTDAMSVPHHPAIALAYAHVARYSEIPYVVYYTDFTYMNEDEKSDLRISADLGGDYYTFNYQSNLDWRNQPEAAGLHPKSDEEQMMFACWRLGLTCSPV